MRVKILTNNGPIGERGESSRAGNWSAHGGGRKRILSRRTKKALGPITPLQDEDGTRVVRREFR